jgi:hypothetical protein
MALKEQNYERTKASQTHLDARANALEREAKALKEQNDERTKASQTHLDEKVL